MFPSHDKIILSQDYFGTFSEPRRSLTCSGIGLFSDNSEDEDLSKIVRKMEDWKSGEFEKRTNLGISISVFEAAPLPKMKVTWTGRAPGFFKSSRSCQASSHNA